MVGNRPPQLVIQNLRNRVDAVRDPRGPTFTAVGDMRVIGRRNAADDRVRNNGLDMSANNNDLMPQGMTEDEALQFAMMESSSMEVEVIVCGTASTAASVPLAGGSSSIVHPHPPTPAAAPTTAPVKPASTPIWVSRTRDAALELRLKTEKEDKPKRKGLARVVRALSDPKDKAVVNALAKVQNEPTPMRLDECLDFMEDLDD